MNSPREIIERAILGKTVTRGVPDALLALEASGYEVVHTLALRAVLVQHATTTYSDPWTVRCRCGADFHDDVPKIGEENARGAYGKWADHVQQTLADVMEGSR